MVDQSSGQRQLGDCKQRPWTTGSSMITGVRLWGASDLLVVLRFRSGLFVCLIVDCYYYFGVGVGGSVVGCRPMFATSATAP